ncbi:MAG: folK [Bacillota bacterium]|nr:MAG: folK [Bacillota bacterium]MBS3951145.1 2-amino-4-hydroxy-6-hydroxymethyldihydropteridine diphosphokinase [Peptococcaceae bacterium]
MPRVFLGLGSNLGERKNELDFAVCRLRQHPGIELIQVAPYLETDPVGYLEQGKFINTVVEIRTILDPYTLLWVLQTIEEEAGRIRTIRWGPRTLDIDILLYDDWVMDEPNLTIPHPRMKEREFVLLPLTEIGPDVPVPPDNLTIRELLNNYRQSR